MLSLPSAHVAVRRGVNLASTTYDGRWGQRFCVLRPAAFGQSLLVGFGGLHAVPRGASAAS